MSESQTGVLAPQGAVEAEVLAEGFALVLGAGLRRCFCAGAACRDEVGGVTGCGSAVRRRWRWRRGAG